MSTTQSHLEKTIRKHNFLCTKHRQQLIEQPEKALLAWKRALAKARFLADEYLWNKATLTYGGAFEIAEIVLAQELNTTLIKRYVGTAAELAYSLRHCSYISDVSLLVAMVKSKLQAGCLPEDEVEALLRPLTDIAFSPESEIGYWAKTSQILAAKSNCCSIH